MVYLKDSYSGLLNALFVPIPLSLVIDFLNFIPACVWNLSSYKDAFENRAHRERDKKYVCLYAKNISKIISKLMNRLE